MQDRPSSRKLICSLAILCMFAPLGCAKTTGQQEQKEIRTSPAPTQTLQQECLGVAKKALGNQAEAVKCGELNTPGVPEVVAVLPARFPHNGDSEMTIRKMVILRKESSGWRTVLTASRQVQNEAGYVGLEYIDDYFKFMGYQLRLSDVRSDGKKAFDVNLIYIERANGGSDETSTEIAWNPVVGRYQEWRYDQDPASFRSEIKNPPHWKPGVKLPASSH